MAGPSWPERIWLGFVGGAGYRRLARQPRGAYPAFAVVALSTALAVSIVSGLAVSHTLRAMLAAWSRLPEFSVTSQRLSLPPGVRAPVRAAADGAVVVLGDSLPPYSNPLGSARVGMVLTPQELVLRPGQGADIALPLQALGTMPLTRDDLRSRLSELAGPGLWIIGGFSVVLQMGHDLLRAVIIAWIALTLARLAGRNPRWPECWRVGLAAWTLPLFAEVARVWFPYAVIWLWLVAGVYAVIGCLSLGPEGDSA